MPTVNDVRVAMRQSKRQEALEMLREILRHNPSADALYLAAELSANEEAAIKHIRRALLLEPDHQPSQKWLKRKGMAPGTFAHQLGEEVIQTIYEQSDRTPLLSRLARWQQLAIFGVLATALLLIIGSGIVILLRSTPETRAESSLPTAAPVSLLNTSAFQEQFLNSGLDLQPARSSSAIRDIQGETLTFALASGGRTYDVNILVYQDIPALIQDRTSINSYAHYANVLSASNVVMIYPKTMDSQTARQLVQTFEAITGV